MTDEFTNPENDNTPNYYDGGVPNNMTPPQPTHDPYGNAYAQSSSPQQTYNPAGQYPAPQFNTQYGNQNPYQQMSNYGGVPQTQTNKNAIISLIVSLATFFIFCGIPIVGTAGAIVGIVFGHKALKETSNTPNSGNGVALAGVICGYVALVASILVGAIVILYVIGLSVATTQNIH